jgi:SAM-dependent methyltransferase
MRKSDSILDYGCGNGIFVRFLHQKGYINVAGYDPYVPEFSELPENKLFDCIIANDVIEHVSDPRVIFKNCVNLLKPGGLLYIGTADSEGVEMKDLEAHIMRLHQPFHRIIITRDTLRSLSKEMGIELIREYKRSYMDTLIPFINYRFLDEFSKALGHNMDRALDPSSANILLRSPRSLFYAFFGYFFPSAYEPAIVLRKQK